MLRLAFARSVAVARAVPHVRPPVASVRLAVQQIRHESSKVSDERRQALKARDDLQRDWDASVITFEQLKPKTLQPSPVSSYFLSGMRRSPDCSQDKYLIDVREPDEVLQGSIPSSVNLPLSVLSGALQYSPAQFKETFGFEKPRKDQEVTFYCRSGVRSTSAADVAKRNGYTKYVHVRHLT